MDVVMAPRRPRDWPPADGARFELRLEKARHQTGSALAAIEAQLCTGPDGFAQWQWHRGKVLRCAAPRRRPPATGPERGGGRQGDRCLASDGLPPAAQGARAGMGPQNIRLRIRRSGVRLSSGAPSYDFVRYRRAGATSTLGVSP